MEDKSKCALLVYLMLVSNALALLSPKGINYEVVALMAIRTKLNDPHSVLDDWDINSVDPCSWSMVTCSPEGSVTAIGMPSQNLSGQLSPDIANLTNLQSVWKNTQFSHTQFYVLSTVLLDRVQSGTAYKFDKSLLHTE
eukprot:Gb_08064 [translate_table: standard]